MDEVAKRRRESLLDGSVPCIRELTRAAIAGRGTLVTALAEYMRQGVMITHCTGLRISLCDASYDALCFRPGSREWTRAMYSPIDDDLTVFGVAEHWRMPSRFPARQVVFLVSSNVNVYAYCAGVLFYQSPGMQQFWCSPIYFEYDNAIFPMTVRHRVKQKAVQIGDLLDTYHTYELQYAMLAYALAVARDRGQVETLKKSNRICMVLLEMEIEIRAGNLPRVFVDRESLVANCDKTFFDTHLVCWIRTVDNPEGDLSLPSGTLHLGGSANLRNMTLDRCGSLYASRSSHFGSVPFMTSPVFCPPVTTKAAGGARPFIVLPSAVNATRLMSTALPAADSLLTPVSTSQMPFSVSGDSFEGSHDATTEDVSFLYVSGGSSERSDSVEGATALEPKTFNMENAQYPVNRIEVFDNGPCDMSKYDSRERAPSTLDKKISFKF